MSAKYTKWVLLITLLMALTLAAALLSLLSGEINISLKELPLVLSSKTGLKFAVITQIRWPRIVLAFAAGGALSLTGAILQGVYRNPLVEPYTLGISGGAAFGIALTIVLGLHLTLGSFMLPLSGFTGAIVALFLVYFLSFKRGAVNINRMLLIGVMVSFVASSAMMFLMAITTTENLQGIIFWMMGSLEEPNHVLIQIMLYSSLAGLVIAYLFARPLNALRLGEDKARHLGVQSTVIIRILFVVASLLTGICVAVTGIIGFVGLIIPHMIRLIIGPDYRVLLISSFLGGSLFLIICDVAARTIIAPNELPIGVITGIVGGILFIIVLARAGLKTKLS
ncbi:MAG: FecCD family ABC transporter permease [Prolixibacteraceae bacterium]